MSLSLIKIAVMISSHDDPEMYKHPAVKAVMDKYSKLNMDKHYDAYEKDFNKAVYKYHADSEKVANIFAKPLQRHVSESRKLIDTKYGKLPSSTPVKMSREDILKAFREYSKRVDK